MEDTAPLVAVSRHSVAYNKDPKAKPAKIQRDKGVLRITSVLDIYRHVRILTGMISNIWGRECGTTTVFRQVLPGLVRVHVGQQVVTVAGYLLRDLEPMCRCSTASSSQNPSQPAVSNSQVHDMYVRHPTNYFSHIIVFLKLRWLLRLHSAACELDHKICSLRSLILGLQYVILQQHAETETDSIFDSKVSQQTGSHMNLQSVLDDITDQLQRALGGSWRGFLEYVGTCDPTRCVMSSKMGSKLSPNQIVSNESLATAIDTIFVTHFLRGSRKESSGRLRELYADFDMLGTPLPELPPLQDAQHLRSWAKAKMKPTRQDREKASHKDMEKLAQLDAVLLTAAMELHLPEIMASAEDIADMTANAMVSADFSDEPAPKPMDFGNTDAAGPPAALAILVDKPQLSPALFDAALHCAHHHRTFPDGIRERLCGILNEEYGITHEQSQRLAIALTQNIDGKRLPESTLLGMEHREKTRLREFGARHNRHTHHLLCSPLVSCPIENGRPAKYTTTPAKEAPRMPFGSAFNSQDMTRSLPDLRGIACRGNLGREPFKVPLSTGPLTMDPELKKLRTTGFFIKMPSLV
mmetsp:Transcript_17598/g.49865  ORF Transcript_17598/g.49865 Transcript_17598/m.49865 type:complete len:581 (+) Transcript_17598:132-1874(+)